MCRGSKSKRRNGVILRFKGEVTMSSHEKVVETRRTGGGSWMAGISPKTSRENEERAAKPQGTRPLLEGLSSEVSRNEAEVLAPRSPERIGDCLAGDAADEGFRARERLTIFHVGILKAE